MEPDFLDLMPYVFAIARHLGTDFDGNSQYDPVPFTYRCRIVGKGLALRRQFSEELTVIVDIYFDPGNEEFTAKDQVYLPPSQAFMDETPVIFSIGRFPDDEGHHHVKIQCGWMYHRQGQ